ncbi:MAG: type II toxin-antitoxin system ParD family antitoxin [Cyanobacteriota bacterium]|jgi:antitoxin ParD1/3/4
MTMNVNLSPQLEAMVKAKVASGRYTSASEVVREALRLMEHQDQLRDLQLQELRRAIQDGLDSGEPAAWNPEAIKAAGRLRLKAQVDSKPGV